MPVVEKPLKSQQEMAEHVIHHLLTQNERSTIDGAACCYRYVDTEGKTLSCAVGSLIHDDYYSESLEYKGVSDADVLDALENSHPNIHISSDFVNYLSSLQRIHDNLEPEVWHEIFIDENGDFIVPHISSWEALNNVYEMNLIWD